MIAVLVCCVLQRVLLSSFHLNGHTLGFHLQTQKLKPLNMTEGLSLGEVLIIQNPVWKRKALILLFIYDLLLSCNLICQTRILSFVDGNKEAYLSRPSAVYPISPRILISPE